MNLLPGVKPHSRGNHQRKKLIIKEVIFYLRTNTTLRKPFTQRKISRTEQGGVAAPPTSFITERYKIEAGCGICQVKIRIRKNTKMMIKQTTETTPALLYGSWFAIIVPEAIGTLGTTPETILETMISKTTSE